MNKNQLMEEVEVRFKNRGVIRERINEYCFVAYGIDNFFSIADKYLHQDFGGKLLNICLARQVPCQNIEHLAIAKLASFLSENGLSAKAVPMAFARDSFTSNNEYKASLIKIPYLFRGRKGGLIVKKESILARLHRESIDGKILDQLKTEDGLGLPDFHYALRKNIFGDNDCFVDFSSFVKEVAFQSVESRSVNMPGYVFIRSGMKERKVHPFDADFSNGQDPRPPADWFYFLYLMMFLDGGSALASTVDEDPRVIAWFSDNMKKIKEICGFSPLLIDTPLKVRVEDLSSKLIEFPMWVDNDRSWSQQIVLSEMVNHDLYYVVEHIEKQLIALS